MTRFVSMTGRTPYGSVWAVLLLFLLAGCARTSLNVGPGNLVSASSGDHAVQIRIADRYAYFGQRKAEGRMDGLKLKGPLYLFTSPGSGYLGIGSFEFRQHEVDMPVGGVVLDAGAVELGSGSYRYSVIAAGDNIIHYLYVPVGGQEFLFVSYVESLRSRPEPPQAWLYENLSYAQIKFVNDFKKRALEACTVAG